MDGCDPKSDNDRFKLIRGRRQSKCFRAARAASSDGEKADEGLHDRMLTQYQITDLEPPIPHSPYSFLRAVADEHFLLKMYGKLVQRCFDDCVNDFTTKSLISREEGCVMRCVDKFLKGSERLGQRFQEQNAAMMQSGQLPGR